MLLALTVQKITLTSESTYHMKLLENVHTPLYYVSCADCFPSVVYEDSVNNRTYKYPGRFTKEAIEYWFNNIPYAKYDNAQYMLDFQRRI